MMIDLTPRRVSEPADFGRVALLVGGASAERDVSLDGGHSVSKALKRLGIRHELYDGQDRLFDAIFARQVDRVFNLMHGPGGEDGAIQGALQLMNVPMTGSGLVGSALTMDKVRSKWVLQRLGLPTPAFERVKTISDARSAAETFGLPVFIKPNNLGSSIGISKVEDEEALEPAFTLARQFSREILVEQFIAGGEYFTGVLERQTFPLIGIETPRAFYDYQAKYLSDDTRYFCPCGLAPDLERSLQERSMEVFDALGASGWGRVDFILDEHSDPWFLEVNTIPGMTDHSLLPQAAAEVGVGFEELVWRILETSL